MAIRTRIVRLLTPLLALAACAPAQAKTEVRPTAHPFLWRIEGKVPSWLYGTIHLPDPRVTALPDEVVKAIHRADVLLTEIDLGAKTRAAAQAASLLPEGKTLADVLPEDLYERLERYLASKRFPLAGVAKMKPWVVMTMLPLLDDLRTMLTQQPLDQKLVHEAEARDKETGALETLDEQLGVFEGFTKGEQAEMLAATLTLLEEAAAAGRKPLAELVDAYLSGDLEALEALTDEMSGLEEHRGLHERLEKVVVIDRNHHMAERVAAKLRAEPRRSYFVAVGALHYAGAEGIVELLQKDGFDVTRIAPPPKTEPKPTGDRGKEPAGARRGR